jgi:hypothetical protein
MYGGRLPRHPFAEVEVVRVTTKPWLIARPDISCVTLDTEGWDALGISFPYVNAPPVFLWFRETIRDYHGVVVDMAALGPK